MTAHPHVGPAPGHARVGVDPDLTAERPATPRPAAPTPVPWARPAIGVPRVRPPHLRLEATVRATRLDASPREVWDALLCRRGLLRGSIWPWVVEFSSAAPVEGCTRLRFGPGLVLPGVLARLERQRYLDLQYSAGAYVLTPRWLRPKRLELRLQARADGGTTVVVRLETLVHPLWRRPWRLLQRARWGLFARRLGRAATSR